MKTPISHTNRVFTEKAHNAARQQLYPNIFQSNSITYRDVTEDFEHSPAQHERPYDDQLSVDVIASVPVGGLRAPLTFWIQERFRRVSYAKWRDVTMTEWNTNSDMPSELYKIKAGLFVYGYYDERTNTFPEVVAISVPSLFVALATESLPFTRGRNPRSNQPFIAIKIDDLLKAGLVQWHQRLTSIKQNAA